MARPSSAIRRGTAWPHDFRLAGILAIISPPSLLMDVLLLLAATVRPPPFHLTGYADHPPDHGLATGGGEAYPMRLLMALGSPRCGLTHTSMTVAAD